MEHKETLLTSSRIFLNIKSLPVIDKTHGMDGKATCILKQLKLLLQYYINWQGQ